MKLLHFFFHDIFHLGVKTETGIVDLAQAAAATGTKNIPSSLDELFSGGLSAQAALTEF